VLAIPVSVNGYKGAGSSSPSLPYIRLSRNPVYSSELTGLEAPAVEEEENYI